MNRGPIYVVGMHGLGDNLHQRAVMRQLIERAGEHPVWLETSWPSVYHDLSGLRFLARGTTLRTQRANAAREVGLFSDRTRGNIRRKLRVWYTPEQVSAKGSVLAAMCAATGVDHSRADFRMPVPQAWIDEARAQIGRTHKPIMVYRPLVERTEWGGCAARNPDVGSYVSLFKTIAARFHVVSIADLVPQIEWAVSPHVHADTVFHRGELRFQALAGLFSMARMVFASPGFAVPLAQAVGAPVVCVFGGYESGRSFSSGARFAPYLPIDTIAPCECFSHAHNCVKAIDMRKAIDRLDKFSRSCR